MDEIPQEDGMGAVGSSKEQEIVGGDVRKALEGELKHKDRMFLDFFHGLDEYLVHPRYVDYIVRHQLAQDSEFRLALEARLSIILQSPTMLSDNGYDLQHFLLVLATYGEIFKEVKLPATTAEILRNRIEFLRLNGQSGGIVDRLSQFLPKH